VLSDYFFLFRKFLINLFLLLLFALSVRVFAFLDPAFPLDIEKRVILARDPQKVKKFFENESLEEKSRPIWVHMGDSLSTGWASKHTLEERINPLLPSYEKLKAPTIMAGSLEDMGNHLASPENTWFSGPNLAGGLLAYLEKKTQKTWVIYSSARTASLLKEPFKRGSRNNRDSLELGKIPSNIDPALRNAILDRVHLVTITLGSNDLCTRVDPTSDTDPSLSDKLLSLRNFYPRAKFLVFKPAPLYEISQKALDALKTQIDQSTGEVRKNLKLVKKYCESFWRNPEGFCPTLSTDEGQKESQAKRSKITQAFEDTFGPLVDPYSVFFSAENRDPPIPTEKLLSSDCFHPSPLSHKNILKTTEDFLDSNEEQFFIPFLKKETKKEEK
jgi:hypothetical protein